MPILALSAFHFVACLALATTSIPALSAEIHCPGNVASVPFHLVNRHQIIVAVSVNHSGPYNFLLDTGTQMTMVDPSLATQLHLATEGTAAVASVGVHASATFAQLDQLEAGSHAVANQKVLVYNLQNLQATGLDIQGVLGEDFLGQFDMLIDNAHSMLCLDDTSAMRGDVKGSHIALLGPAVCRLSEGDQTPEAHSELFRDWQRTQTQSSATALRSLRQQMDVRLCLEQEPPAERQPRAAIDPDRTHNALSRARTANSCFSLDKDLHGSR
jgi:hypothetical protein